MLRASTIPAIAIVLMAACRNASPAPGTEMTDSLNLKTGTVISCGPENQQFGSVDFAIAGPKALSDAFNLGVKLLHSFEYDEAEKTFASIIRNHPDCAMAYWGVAMSNFHPLWTPPLPDEFEKGSKAIRIARSLAEPGTIKKEYIDALATFYEDSAGLDHLTRCRNYANAMEGVYRRHPGNTEAAVFYALSLNAAAVPSDKSFFLQKKAADILNDLYQKYPSHPGVIHYIIHSYDYPGLADLALQAARRYAAVAPSSAHALHMPSHIFTRLGYWQESIESNLASVNSAKCYAQAAGIKGHWDEELHGMDYLMYAYLQRGDNISARRQLNKLLNIREITPANFKVAFAFAAIPARYVLENRNWRDAARLHPHEANFSWNDYPWQRAMIFFARILGKVHVGDLADAKSELDSVKQIHAGLVKANDRYKAGQVNIQINTAEAWIKWKEHDSAGALRLMRLAADLEDSTEKHPVTPGELLPARELLGDMLMEMGKYPEALAEYEASLRKAPNRVNGLYGAAVAARKTGNLALAKTYYDQLRGMAVPGSGRGELIALP